MSKMMRAQTFSDVVYNWDDQVIVRQLLIKYVPSEIRALIVDEFNEFVDKRNAIEERQAQEESKP